MSQSGIPEIPGEMTNEGFAQAIERMIEFTNLLYWCANREVFDERIDREHTSRDDDDYSHYLRRHGYIDDGAGADSCPRSTGVFRRGV